MNKVPFVLKKDTQIYVDVHDVERGLSCNCICPSCDTPLIAKQGQNKAWHFAHATRCTSNQTQQDCEYSFYVSVTHMAKQLFSELDHVKLLLPEYRYAIEYNQPNQFYSLSKKIVITKASCIELGNIGIESKISRHHADVVGRVDEYPLIIGFTHPEKQFLADSVLLDGERAGIIGIDLTATLSTFYEQMEKGESTFKEALVDYLFKDAEHMKWLYHPRENQKIEEAKQQLKLSSTNKCAGGGVSTSTESEKFDFIDSGWPSLKLYPADEEINFTRFGIKYRTVISNNRISVFHARNGKESLQLEIDPTPRKQEKVKESIAQRFKGGIKYPFSNSLRFSLVVGNRFLFLRGERLEIYTGNGFSIVDGIARELVPKVLNEQFHYDSATLFTYLTGGSR